MSRFSATMPGRLLHHASLWRAGLTIALAASALLANVADTQNAVANGDTRAISIRHMHTKEELTVTFRRDGRYVADALEKLNWALRDWRIDEPIKMDPRLFDLAWEVQRAVGSDEPFHVVSAYRSPGTNSMLRRRSRAVAKHSQHMLGKAMDFYLPDVQPARVREAGMRLQRGGVGFYPNAHTPFVHLDAGSVRSWPRMTRDQLVRLFPDEKTVHLPADGQPLAGYEIAKSEIVARGGAVAGYATADLDEGAVVSSGRKSLWASLFGGDDEEEDARPQRGRRPVAKPQPTVMAYAPQSGTGMDAGESRFGVNLMAPTSPEPQPRPERQPPVADISPVAPERESRRPSLVEAPLPVARPKGLTQFLAPEPPDGPTQIAGLISPNSSGMPMLALLPPRRPLDIAAPPPEATATGRLIAAPLPPVRPTLLANNLSTGSSTETTNAVQIAPAGRLVAITHPLPPARPNMGGTAVTRLERPSASHTPIAAQYGARERSGQVSLFADASEPTPERRPTTVATTRAKATNALPPGWVIGPSPAASLGFSHAEPGEAKAGTFSGPAVKPLPTTYVQN